MEAVEAWNIRDVAAYVASGSVTAGCMYFVGEKKACGALGTGTKLVIDLAIQNRDKQREQIKSLMDDAAKIVRNEWAQVKEELIRIMKGGEIHG